MFRINNNDIFIQLLYTPFHYFKIIGKYGKSPKDYNKIKDKNTSLKNSKEKDKGWTAASQISSRPISHPLYLNQIQNRSPKELENQNEFPFPFLT